MNSIFTDQKQAILLLSSQQLVSSLENIKLIFAVEEIVR